MEFGFEFHTQNGIGILNSKNGRNSKLNSKTQNGIQNGIHFKCDMEYEIRKKKNHTSRIKVWGHVRAD